jgi:hypothetical protein
MMNVFNFNSSNIWGIAYIGERLVTVLGSRIACSIDRETTQRKAVLIFVLKGSSESLGHVECSGAKDNLWVLEQPVIMLQIGELTARPWTIVLGHKRRILRASKESSERPKKDYKRVSTVCPV